MPPNSEAEGAVYPCGLVGGSTAIQRILRQIQELKNNRWPVLITGESGTGKELVARALHAVSPGPSEVFVAVDCASLPATLAESLLFGHQRGSFTGATESSPGLLEQGNGGTVFLDEIGELPLGLQPKLLRALQQCEARPLGSRQAVKLNIRVLAATNRDLAAEVRAGRFRADLFYRLNVINLQVPPLRERRSDIPVLVDHFLRQYACAPSSFPAEIMEGWVASEWPGNVRQLGNSVMRWIALGRTELGLARAAGRSSGGGENKRLTVDPQATGASELVQPGVRMRPQTERRNVTAERGNTGTTWVEGEVVFPNSIVSLINLERQAIVHALQLTSGNLRLAAECLGIGRTTLYRKMKEHRCLTTDHASSRL